MGAGPGHGEADRKRQGVRYVPFARLPCAKNNACSRAAVHKNLLKFTIDTFERQQFVETKTEKMDSSDERKEGYYQRGSGPIGSCWNLPW